MKKSLFNLVCLILCVLLLAGCGKPAAPAPTASAPAASTPAASAPAASEPVSSTAAPAVLGGQGSVWRAQFTTLRSDGLTAALRKGAAQGETLYYISSGVIADETPEGVSPEWPEQYWVYGPILVKVTPDGTSEILPYTPERPESQPGVNSGVLFEQLAADADGSLWVLENRYQIREEDETSREERALVHLQADGTVLSRLPLDALAVLDPGEKGSMISYSFTVPGIASDGKGGVCVAVHEYVSGNGNYAQSNRLCVLDAQSGELRHTIELDGEIAGLVRLGGGAIAVASYHGSTPVFALVDTTGADVTELAAADDFLTDLVGGAGDSLYYGAGDSFYRLNTAGGESEKLFDWSACDVAHGGEDSVCVLDDGRVVTTASRERADGVQSELIVLSPTAVSETQERKTLRLAVMNLYGFTSEMVSRFNRSQTEYRIEVTDYSQFNDYSSSNPEDWNAGLTKLQTELIAGNVPDLIDISLLPVSRLGEKGLLTDLLPYIDADPEFGREQLNMHVLEAFEEKGKLYQTVSNYYVMTTLGRSDIVGEHPGWTMEDFSAAMQGLKAENPESTVFDVYTTRDDALTFLLYLQLEDYVDWSTGECYFDSESFKQLLSFVRSFPTAYDWGADVTPMEIDPDLRLAMGLQLMKQCNLSCFEDVQANTVGLGGAPGTFVGYPTESGVGSMFAQIGNAFAISSACAEKEAAWQFVRQFFLPAYQDQLSGSVFPTNLSVYEEMKREAQSSSFKRNPDGSYALDAEGQRIEADRGSTYVAGTEVKLRAVTPEEVALVEELTAATTHVLSTDNSLKEILVSGAAPYFVDQRSLDETVRQIQSRASIYINEQR